MNTKQEPPPSLPKLMTLKKGLKLAEQWVRNMPGDVEEAGDMEMEARPSRLGLGAKVPRKSQVGPINDPVYRRLHKKFVRKKNAGDEDSVVPPKNEIDNDNENENDYDYDDEEKADSRTNAFAKKRVALLPTRPQAKKKLK